MWIYARRVRGDDGDKPNDTRTKQRRTKRIVVTVAQRCAVINSHRVHLERRAPVDDIAAQIFDRSVRRVGSDNSTNAEVCYCYLDFIYWPYLLLCVDASDARWSDCQTMVFCALRLAPRFIVGTFFASCVAFASITFSIMKNVHIFFEIMRRSSGI